MLPVHDYEFRNTLNILDIVTGPRDLSWNKQNHIWFFYQFIELIFITYRRWTGRPGRGKKIICITAPL